MVWLRKSRLRALLQDVHIDLAARLVLFRALFLELGTLIDLCPPLKIFHRPRMLLSWGSLSIQDGFTGLDGLWRSRENASARRRDPRLGADNQRSGLTLLIVLPSKVRG